MNLVALCLWDWKIKNLHANLSLFRVDASWCMESAWTSLAWPPSDPKLFDTSFYMSKDCLIQDKKEMRYLTSKCCKSKTSIGNSLKLFLFKSIVLFPRAEAVLRSCSTSFSPSATLGRCLLTVCCRGNKRKLAQPRHQETPSNKRLEKSPTRPGPCRKAWKQLDACYEG